MLQGTPGRVREYYDEHPISEARVLEALAAQGFGGPLTAEALFEFDQDHYGGLAAVDALAGRAGVGASSRVLDLCAGLGGPARFLASRRGSAVEAEDLSGEWRSIVRKRLELHRALRPQREARLGQRSYEECDQLHAYFVRLIEAGKLGGGRFTATR